MNVVDGSSGSGGIVSVPDNCLSFYFTVISTSLQECNHGNFG